MYRYIYNIPFFYIIFMLIIFEIWWLFLKSKVSKKIKIWKTTHFLLFISCLLFFIYVSLLERSSTIEQHWPPLFWSYKLAFCNGNYDYFQEIYLNIISFFFISFFVVELADTKVKVLYIFFFLACFSILTECMQYYFSLGLAECDDIISNLIGIVFGIWFNKYGFLFYDKFLWEIKQWKKLKK